MKKLLLTLMCVIAAAIPAFADVMYEPVAVSDLQTGDEVAMVAYWDYKHYFATADLDNNTNRISCLITDGEKAEETINLSDSQAAQVQNFIITKGASTISLKRSNANDYLELYEKTTKPINFSIKWGEETQFTLVSAQLPKRGYYLQGAVSSIGLFTMANPRMLGPANNTLVSSSCTGIFLYKKVQNAQPLFLALSTSLITIQMKEGQTVTGKLPTITPYLNYGTTNQTEATDVEYTYTAVQSDESDEATDVISVDENGVVTALKAGIAYVKVEVKSDNYIAKPVYVIVNVIAPVVEVYTGTTFTAGATSAFYVTVAGENKPALFGVVENGTSTKYELTPGTYYIYPAENRKITSFTVDGVPGEIYDYAGLHFGHFSVTAGQEPKEIIVNTIEPVVIETGTKFTIVGGGGLEVWRRKGWEQYVFYGNLEPNADGVAYMEIPSLVDGESYSYLVSANANSHIISGVQNGQTLSIYPHYESAPNPGNYTILNGDADCTINCVPKSAIEDVTFNLTIGSSAVLKDADNNVVQTFTYGTYSKTFTVTLIKDKRYYIYAAEGYVLKSVTNADGDAVAIDSSMGEPCVMIYSDDSESYTITANRPPVNMYFPDSREVTIYRYTSPRNAMVNFAEKTDVNTFDLYSGLESGQFIIGANEGYEITSIVTTPATNVKIFTGAEYPNFKVQDEDGEDKSLGTFAYLYVNKGITDFTITVQKIVEPVKVEFAVTEGSRAFLMHQNGTQWVTDETFNATSGAIDKVADLDHDTQYYIFAAEGYKLTEVLDDNGEPMTIESSDESMPYATTYAMFNTTEAPSMITITAVEDKPEVNPGDLASGQMVTFDFCDNTARLDLSNAEERSSVYYFANGKTMLGDGGAVMLEFNGTKEAAYTPNEYLSIGSSTGFNGNSFKLGTMTVKFTDATSYLEKIEFEFADGSQNFASVSNGTILGTVWEPATAAAAPGMNVVKAANEVKSVTFTPAAATGSWGNNSVNIRKMMVTYTGAELPTGIETVEASANDVEAVYYNLQGVRVENPGAGIYVRVQGNKVDKILVK